MMTAKLFEAALGIAPPWTVASVDFDVSAKTLTVVIDFRAGSRFEVSGHAGVHPVHDTVTKNYRHLNFFEHECHLQVRTPRVKLPSGSVRLGWLRMVGSSSDSDARSGLRFHTELFSGYGDSLMDYNRKRTVLSIGLTLLDW